MTLASEVTRVQYEGTGLVDTYAYAFQIFDDADLVVIETDTDEASTTLTLDSDYTVTGAGDDAGGTVVLSSALTSGYRLTIYSLLDYVQEVDLSTQQELFLEVIETAFDKTTRMVQQLDEELGRCLKYDVDTEDADIDTDITAVIAARDEAASSASAASTSESNASDFADEAEAWASKVDGQVEATDYSAKAYAIGGTGVTNGAGAAKEWATKAEDSTVDGAEYSAKHYAAKAAASVGSVKVSANDTTPGVLNGKLVAGDGLTLTEGSDGGDETFTAALDLTDDHTWSSVQASAITALTDAASITWTMTAGNDYSVTLGEVGRTLADPTGMVAGQRGVLKVDSTSGTITTWGTGTMLFSSGTAPTSSGGIDIYTYWSDGTYVYLAAFIEGAA